MRKYSLLLLFLLIPVGLFEAAAVGQHLDGHLTLANKDRIPAKIQMIDQNRIKFGSSLFAETVQLKSQYLRSVGFHPNVTSENRPEDSVEYLFRFKSGTRLIGKLLSIDHERCEIESAILGKVSFPLASLLEFGRASRLLQNTTRYSALSWQALGPTFRPNVHGNIVVGENELLVLPEKFDGAGRCQFEFLVNAQTEFQIILNDPKNKAVASIAVSNGDLVVEAGGDLEFGEFQPVQGTARLSLNWRGDALHLLNELDQSIIGVSLTKQVPLVVSIKTEQSPLQFREIVVSTDSTPITSKDLPVDQIVVWDPAGKTRLASEISFQNDIFSLGNVNSGNPNVVLGNVSRIWFGAGESAPAMDSTNTYSCYWSRGDRFRCHEFALDGEAMTFQSEEFESENFITGLPPAEVFLPKLAPAEVDRASSSQPSGTEFRLAISGIPFSGSYSWGNASSPIRWRFFGFPDPVTLNIERKLEIRRVGRAKREVDKESPDRIVLKDGSILPCKIETAGEKELQFRSTRVTTTRVLLSEVRCCFFDSTNLEWAKKLTNETVQRALTLPRFSRETCFSHVVIGKNGDLLRGCLIAIHANEIEFESRFEPLLIPRTNVVGIIAVDRKVDEDAVDSSTQPRDDVSPETPQTVVAHIHCGNDFIAVGRYVSLDDGKVVVDSPILGQLSLVVSKIRHITFNSQLRNVSTLQGFTDWQLVSAIGPRWIEDVEYAADANVLLNQVAPDFEVTLLSDTRSFRLADHAGKVVVINFWESSSLPSILGVPEYLSVIQKFSPNDVVFIAPNQGETASSVKSFVASEKWNSLAVALDFRKEVSEKYHVTGIPHLTIIDREGKVRYIKVGYTKNSARELEEQIRELLGL